MGVVLSEMHEMPSPIDSVRASAARCVKRKTFGVMAHFVKKTFRIAFILKKLTKHLFLLRNV